MQDDLEGLAQRFVHDRGGKAQFADIFFPEKRLDLGIAFLGKDQQRRQDLGIRRGVEDLILVLGDSNHRLFQNRDRPFLLHPYGDAEIIQVTAFPNLGDQR